MQTNLSCMIFRNAMNKTLRLFLLMTLLFISPVLRAQQTSFSVIPEPVYLKKGNGSVNIYAVTTIAYPGELKASGELLNEAIRPFTGGLLAVNTSIRPGTNQIRLELDSASVKEKEGYHLLVKDDQILIKGHDQAGVFYGIQSLMQLWSPAAKNVLRLEKGEIRDYPRFNYRGMHLDVGRHMYSVAFLKKFIDLLSVYKFNIFHWHLTEDQGWRIEIKRYPKLQSVSAWRNGTIIGHKKEAPHTFDGQKYGGYYTQDQIREVVRYAASKYVNILPEIEMPGHALAALTAYPQLGCTGGPYQTAQFWGVFDDVFCAGNEEVYQFMEDVLDEVVGLFPYAYVHIGGDECPKLKWKHCAKCQKKIKENGLKDEHELQGYFMKRMEKYLNSKNRKAVGWDEVLEGGVSKNTTIMNWRGEQSGIAAAKEKYEVIMTPENMLYFDYYQSLDKNEPVAAGNYTPLSKVYGYEPIPDSLSPEQAAYIKGVQGGIWTEYMKDEKHLEYMVFPRALALSEIAWSGKKEKNYPWFLEKLRHHRNFLNRMKVNYYPYFDEITSEIKPGTNGNPLLTLKTTLPKAQIRYTLDGSVPNLKSKLYQGPVLLNRSMVLNAGLFVGNKRSGRIFNQAYLQHSGIQKKISLAHAPAGKYNFPAGLLLNGIEGHHRFNDSQWLGFSGKDLEATIDLGALTPVSQIGINVFHYPWQRMWAPKKLSFLVSVDGKEFKEVYTGGNFDLNGINKVRAKFPLVKVRYLKIIGENIGRVPVGGYGEGEKAWLMADEIIIN
ncbi:family 20 glycosylhydrolase [Pedobacter sp. KBW06]|uniref:glycoside hydrolase family 20 protein n=1 Tax=Pedobacter sp. KBW06 TaxID=2153359 RepID=UPI001F3E2FE2|nr:family 20 glycosylhydrolase [Pedobacter sp. KBW06]